MKTVGVRDLLCGVVKMAPQAADDQARPGLIRRPPEAKKTIGSVFQKLAHAHPDRPFVRFEGRTTTYGEANRRVNRYAAVLSEAGVGKGDVVAILSKNNATDLLLMLATVKLGAVAGMLNYNQRGEVLEHSMKLLDATVLVYDPECGEALESVSESILPEHVYDFSAFDEAAEGKPDTDPEITAQLPASTKAFYIFTSGTTGKPKASVMSQTGGSPATRASAGWRCGCVPATPCTCRCRCTTTTRCRSRSRRCWPPAPASRSAGRSRRRSSGTT